MTTTRWLCVQNARALLDCDSLSPRVSSAGAAQLERFVPKKPERSRSTTPTRPTARWPRTRSFTTTPTRLGLRRDRLHRPYCAKRASLTRPTHTKHHTSDCQSVERQRLEAHDTSHKTHLLGLVLVLLVELLGEALVAQELGVQLYVWYETECVSDQVGHESDIRKDSHVRHASSGNGGSSAS